MSDFIKSFTEEQIFEMSFYNDAEIIADYFNHKNNYGFFKVKKELLEETAAAMLTLVYRDEHYFRVSIDNYDYDGFIFSSTLGSHFKIHKRYESCFTETTIGVHNFEFVLKNGDEIVSTIVNADFYDGNVFGVYVKVSPFQSPRPFLEKGWIESENDYLVFYTEKLDDLHFVINSSHNLHWPQPGHKTVVVSKKARIALESMQWEDYVLVNTLDHYGLCLNEEVVRPRLNYNHLFY